MFMMFTMCIIIFIMFMMFTMCICRIRMTSYHNPIRLDLHFRNRGGEGGICLRQCVWRFTKNNESQVNDIVIATRQVVVQNHACGRAPSFALTPPRNISARSGQAGW